MFKLKMDQVFNAPASRLFEAWTNVDMIKTWFAPGDMTIPEATAEVKVGGAYRIVMEEDKGEQHIVSGEYKEVITGEKVVFSWCWENSESITLVRIYLEVIDENTTKLHLSHNEFIDEYARDQHKEGWIGCLANLQKAV